MLGRALHPRHDWAGEPGLSRLRHVSAVSPRRAVDDDAARLDLWRRRRLCRGRGRTRRGVGSSRGSNRARGHVGARMAAPAVARDRLSVGSGRRNTGGIADAAALAVAAAQDTHMKGRSEMRHASHHQRQAGESTNTQPSAGPCGRRQVGGGERAGRTGAWGDAVSTAAPVSGDSRTDRPLTVDDLAPGATRRISKTPANLGQRRGVA